MNKREKIESSMHYDRIDTSNFDENLATQSSNEVMDQDDFPESNIQGQTN